MGRATAGSGGDAAWASALWEAEKAEKTAVMDKAYRVQSAAEVRFIAILFVLKSLLLSWVSQAACRACALLFIFSVVNCMCVCCYFHSGHGCRHIVPQHALAYHLNTAKTYIHTYIHQALALAKLNGAGNKPASGSATSHAASKQVRQPAQSAAHRPQMSRGQGPRRGRGGGGGGGAGRGGMAARRGASAWSDDSGGSDGDEVYEYDYDSAEERAMDRSTGGDKAARMEFGDFVTPAGRQTERSSAQRRYDDVDAEEDRQIQLAMAASMEQQHRPVVVNVNIPSLFLRSFSNQWMCVCIYIYMYVYIYIMLYSSSFCMT